MTIKGIFNWLVGLPIAVVGIGFAVANRQWITVSFDPFNRAHPFATVDMPLWALFFCGIFVGIFAGWMVAWIDQGKHRKAARAAQIELVRTQQHARAREARAQVIIARSPPGCLVVKVLSAADVARLAPYRDIVEALREGFRADIATPVRHHHETSPMTRHCC